MSEGVSDGSATRPLTNRRACLPSEPPEDAGEVEDGLTGNASTVAGIVGSSDDVSSGAAAFAFPLSAGSCPRQGSNLPGADPHRLLARPSLPCRRRSSLDIFPRTCTKARPFVGSPSNGDVGRPAWDEKEGIGERGRLGEGAFASEKTLRWPGLSECGGCECLRSGERSLLPCSASLRSSSVLLRLCRSRRVRVLNLADENDSARGRCCHISRSVWNAEIEDNVRCVPTGP